MELQGKILDSWRDNKSRARKERASKLSIILPKAWRLDPASASQRKPSLSLSPFFLLCSEFLEISSCSNHQLASGTAGRVRSEARNQHHPSSVCASYSAGPAGDTEHSKWARVRALSVLTPGLVFCDFTIPTHAPFVLFCVCCCCRLSVWKALWLAWGFIQMVEFYFFKSFERKKE